MPYMKKYGLFDIMRIAVKYVMLPLAGVGDVYNGIVMRGDFVGDVMFYGCGAGKYPLQVPLLRILLILFGMFSCVGLGRAATNALVEVLVEI